MAAAVGSYIPIVQSITAAEYAAAISSRFQLQPLTLSSQWFMNPRQDQQDMNHYNNLFNHQEEDQQQEEDEYTAEDLRRYDLIDEELAADNQYYTTRGGDHDGRLSKEAIAKRLNYVRNSSLHPHLDDTICVVCQDRLLFQKVDDEKKTIVGLDCGHDFHAGCIERWLLIKNRCPLCNATGIRL